MHYHQWKGVRTLMIIKSIFFYKEVKDNRTTAVGRHTGSSLSELGRPELTGITAQDAYDLIEQHTSLTSTETYKMLVNDFEFKIRGTSNEA